MKPSGFQVTPEQEKKLAEAEVDVAKLKIKGGCRELDIRALLNQPEHMIMANELGDFVERYDRAHENLDGKEHALARSEMFIAMLVVISRLGGSNSVINPDATDLGEIVTTAWKQGNEMGQSQRSDIVDDLIAKLKGKFDEQSDKKD